MCHETKGTTEKLQRVVCRWAAGLLLAAAPLGAAWGAADGRPNLVFVFSDQHSWDLLGCYGNRDVQTPHFDALAAQGVRFNHCVSQSPVCTPYRGMLLSGRHPLGTGAMQNTALAGKSRKRENAGKARKMRA